MIIGAVIIEDRRLEDNLDRKERYHCYSMDAAEFEGSDYGTDETPETQMEKELDAERIIKVPKIVSKIVPKIVSKIRI